MNNTKITYTYRDYQGIKRHKNVILRGHVGWANMENSLVPGCLFIPGQVGLPYPQLDWETDDYQFPSEFDHVWCEILPTGFQATSLSPTVDLAAEKLIENFNDVQWDEPAAKKELGIK